MENLYEKAVELITSREKFHICLGLDRVKKILEILDNPQEQLKIIHVAGTNGKGSTCAILSKILTYANYKTGLYTSPHIQKYTERIKINGKDIPERDFADIIFKINTLAKQNEIYLTEFELLTVCAYKYFAEKEVDICIIETGLGGRLDATNVISQNTLAIITSISLDHTDRLGNSIEEIAYEKAGIIKESCPILCAENNAGIETIKTIAKEKNSALIFPKTKVSIIFENNTNYALYKNEKLEFGLLGLWQEQNLQLALSGIEFLNENGYDIPFESIRKALKTVFWTCRMQYLKKQNILLDGTHNPDGARVLKQSLDFYFPDKKRVWIYGSLTTKDYKKVMETLFEPNDEVYFFNFEYPNAVKLKDLQKYKTNSAPMNLKDLDYLLHENRDKLIIISGSFYMLGQILEKSYYFQNIAEVVNIY